MLHLRSIITLFFVVLLNSRTAFAWGKIGHEIIARSSSLIVPQGVYETCQTSAEDILQHTNDPDMVWKQKRREFKNEPRMHFFHLDDQASDWREQYQKRKIYNLQSGGLVFRIVEWMTEAKTLRLKRDYDALRVRLYGLSHYAGDLTQPLHVTKDYDGQLSGVKDLHSQFETKMVGRFQKQIEAQVRSNVTARKIPPLYASLNDFDLITDLATQSLAKKQRLVDAAKKSIVRQKNGPRFIKKELFQHAGSLAIDQLTISSQLWAYIISSICGK